MSDKTIVLLFFLKFTNQNQFFMKPLDFPLIKVTICFVIGVLVSYYLKPPLFIAISGLLFSIIIFVVLFFSIKKNKRFNLYFGITTFVISFLIGVVTLLLNTNSLEKSNYVHYKKAFEKPQSVTLTLREKLKGNDHNHRYVALINKIENKMFSGKIIVNIQKNSALNKLIVGNTIRVKTILQKHSIPKNPNQFDYGKYLTDKQIYAQVYADKSEIEISTTIKKDIWYYVAKLHTHIVSNLEKHRFNTTEMNVALALILGQRQEISPDIIRDYQYSGATHILSVSGLHVGFIMLFISFILKPIPNNRNGSLIKLAVILILLTLFAIISGLSASVLRSVVMFSFLALGNHLRRTINIYHTLLVSMLLILLFEPYFLFDVGFQLSYLALFFILWLQPILKKIWKPKNSILIYIWNVLTVSFAAQIGTFPLCLYYFHQFPGLFFITNIIILPALSFIMIMGILVVFLAVFNANPVFFIRILEKSIYLLNQTTHYIASFESFVIRNISFHFYHLMTFYLLIVATIMWVKKPTYQKLFITLSTLILLQIVFIFTKIEVQKKQEFVVYNQKQKTIITERNGNNVILFTDDTLKKETQNKAINSYLIGSFSKIKSIQKIKNTLFFNKEKIFIIDSANIYSKQIKPDIIILRQSPKINLDRLLENLHPKIIVADASNTYSIQKYWKATCLKKKIPFHATFEKGYYQLSF